MLHKGPADTKRVTHHEGLKAVYPPPGDNIECVTLAFEATRTSR